MCKGLKEEQNIDTLILVTKDIVMRLKAQLLAITAEDFSTEQISELDQEYTGRTEAYIQDKYIKDFKKQGISIKKLYCCDADGNRTELHTFENEFVLLKSDIGTKKTLLGKVRHGKVLPLEYKKKKPYDISPKNMGQYFLQEALMAPASEIPLVIVQGMAGTAKTFYSLAVGLEQTMNTNEYRSLLITRPNIKFDDDIGYLKGDEMEKIMPLIRPCYDNLEQLLSDDIKNENKDTMTSKIQYLFDKGIIKAEAMAYMRGRSLANMYMLVDECQNSTPNQMLGLITRAGVGTKIVITGDIKQIDNPKLDKKNNGLSFASERMRGSDLCMQVLFSKEECERSELSNEAAQRLSTDRLK